MITWLKGQAKWQVSIYVTWSKGTQKYYVGIYKSREEAEEAEEYALKMQKDREIQDAKQLESSHDHQNI